MIYSRTSASALQALSYLATFPPGEVVPRQKIARVCHFSPTYLAKIFQALTRARILQTVPGSRGGIAFRQPPSNLTLWDIVQSLDDVSSSPLKGCVMGWKRCGDQTPCPVHTSWKKARRIFQKILGTTTLSQCATQLQKGVLASGREAPLSKELKNVFVRRGPS